MYQPSTYPKQTIDKKDSRAFLGCRTNEIKKVIFIPSQLIKGNFWFQGNYNGQKRSFLPSINLETYVGRSTLLVNYTFITLEKIKPFF